MKLEAVDFSITVLRIYQNIRHRFSDERSSGLTYVLLSVQLIKPCVTSPIVILFQEEHYFICFRFNHFY